MKEKTKNIRRFFLGAICVLLLLLAILVSALGLWAERQFATSAGVALLEQKVESHAPPVFYAYRFTDRANRVGEEALLESGGSAQVETYIGYQEIPRDMVNAVVAIEDKRFFEHRGVDWYRTAAATLNYAFGFSDRFGASTITQQLVKNVTGKNEISVARKLQEVFYARDIERKLDKTEILERYLNLLPLSDGCEGIAAGAEHFFGKAAADLNVAECATLAAMTNNPSYYHPAKYPEHTLSRRNLILSEMQKQGCLGEEEYRQAVNTPLQIQEEAQTAQGEPVRSWYLDMVLDDVVTDFAAQYQVSRAEASQKVLFGGLRIDVAMDPEIQKEVEDYYKKAVRMPKNSAGESAQSALIVIDPQTGDILGVAGAVGEKTANRLQNFATQTKRPPGSAIKPLTVYSPALELGTITWASVYDDVPVDFGTNNNRPWPRNATGVYRGLTTIPYAVAHSVNTVAVRVLQDVGAQNSFRFAKEKFHLESLLGEGEVVDTNPAALALGQMNYGVTLREITAAYTVFADGGVYHPFRSYYRVTDSDGRLILSKPDSAEQVMSQENAAIMTKLLQGVIQNGTSRSVSLDKICYTPNLICGVWCGFAYPEPIRGNNPCLSIWNTLMRRFLELRETDREFAVPESLIRCAYCKDSGKLTGVHCSLDPRGNRTEIGWFVRGTEPKESCDCHIPVRVQDSTGGVCGFGSYAWEGERVALIRVNRNFPMQITISDAQYVWRGDPNVIPLNPDSSQAYFEAGWQGFCGRSATQTPYNRSRDLSREEPLAPWDWNFARLPQEGTPEEEDEE